MRPFRFIVPLLAAAAATLMAPAAASAEPYPAPPPAATVSVSTTAVGGSVVFTATGFIVGEDVDIDVTYEATDSGAAYTGRGAVVLARAAAAHDVLALPVPRAVVKTVQADDSGTVSTALSLTRVGTAVITATGQQSGVSVSATVKVLASGAGDTLPGGDSLPTTGPATAATWMKVLGGLVVVLLGAVLVWWALVWRRRSTGTPAEG
ncbi:MAG TPA: hypothetical protein VNV66_15415 [Pilimelia sp.]|nr:hypothetical protein [Pilimelia sp.]